MPQTLPRPAMAAEPGLAAAAAAAAAGAPSPVALAELKRCVSRSSGALVLIRCAHRRHPLRTRDKRCPLLLRDPVDEHAHPPRRAHARCASKSLPASPSRRAAADSTLLPSSSGVHGPGRRRGGSSGSPRKGGGLACASSTDAAAAGSPALATTAGIYQRLRWIGVASRRPSLYVVVITVPANILIIVVVIIID